MPSIVTTKGIIQPLRSATCDVAATDDGALTFTVTNEGVTHVVRMTPGEAQGMGSSLIGLAAIVDYSNRQRSAAKAPAVLVPNGRH